MIKKINIEEIPFNSYEPQIILADGSIRGELFNVDKTGQEVGERQKSVVFFEPYPFTLTALQRQKLTPETEIIEL